MHIKRLVLDNIKGFSHVDIDFTRPSGSAAGWTVLAGRNGSGKSTIFKAIALAVVGDRTALRLVPSFSDWLNTKKQAGGIATRIKFNPHDDRFAGDDSDQLGEEFWTRMGWIKIENKQEPQIIAPDNKAADRARNLLGPQGEFYFPSTDGPIESPPVEDGPWNINPNGWFIKGFGALRSITDTTEKSPEIRGTTGHRTRLQGLFSNVTNISGGISFLRDLHHQKSSKRAGASELADVTLKLLNDGLLPDGARAEGIGYEGLNILQDGVLLPLSTLSDGYQNTTSIVLNLLSDLRDCYGTVKINTNNGHCEVPHSGVVLIDEIETHLHVSWQKDIGYWLKSRFPNIQFIVSTHSPFICQAADPRGLIRLPGPGDEGAPEHVSEEVYNTVVNGGVDDAVMTSLFGVEQSHSDESEKLRDEVAHLEALVMRKKATKEQTKRLKALLPKLPRNTTSAIERSLRVLEK